MPRILPLPILKARLISLLQEFLRIFRRIAIFFVIIFCMGSLFFFYGAYHALQRQNAFLHTLYTPQDTVPADIKKRAIALGEKIQHKDYGFGYAPWNAIMTQGFFASALENITLAYPNDLDFKQSITPILKSMYAHAYSEAGEQEYSQSNVNIEGGVIYRAQRLRILESYTHITQDKNLEESLQKDMADIAGQLQIAPQFTAESYTGLAWYTDNAEIYRVLAGYPQYKSLVQSWKEVLKSHTGPSGLPLAESYYLAKRNDTNQVRGSASAWILGSIAKDQTLFSKFFPLFYDNFFDQIGAFAFIRDVPRHEKKINMVFDGPLLGPYSSSGTILAVPALCVANKYQEASKLLASFDTLFIAPALESTSWAFGQSLLLDSLRLFAESSCVYQSYSK